MILVTGGTGFIGRRVVAGLAARGRPVRVLTRRARSGVPDGVEIVPGDLLDVGSIRAAVANVDIVVHLAAVFGGEHLFSINVDGTRELGLAAAREGVTSFIHCSSVLAALAPSRFGI